ncbi:MAG: hypothetical protein CVU95_03325 [Firmicutes bacterium HGW-Firmicutes-2]|jgi:beta-lactamase regulating signal transducer with metallopeptidase domain|nr:MAG: hypothetical protein CVU95_03325 [Firmicutes bacterium HGW-Firmicutes-2]
MLEKIFLQIINMSYVSSIVILFIIGARLLLKKAPKKFAYILWAVALFRLIVPMSFESILSIIPVNPMPISNDVLYDTTPNVTAEIFTIDQSISGTAADVASSVNPMQVWIFLGSLLWIAGLVVLLIYGMVSLIKIKNRLKYASHEKDNIYRSDYVDTPFVLGLIQPKIYLPNSLSESEKEYIVLHEQTHIKRFDHAIRFISYLAVCIHWFNPLVWIAFWLSGKDMEMSCDESVIRQLGHRVKKEYSQSLLNLSTGRRRIGMTPLAFGEGDTKGRIKNILSFKQPKFFIIIVAVMILIIAIFGLLSNPRRDEPDLSLLNIDNFLSSMATGGDITVETENQGILSLSPNSNFLETFEHGKWKEKKVNAPFESSPTLKIVLHDGYYIRFYSYENFAMIMNEETQEKYRYYTIPEEVYVDLLSYVLKNGRTGELALDDEESTSIRGNASDEVTSSSYQDLGYITGFEAFDLNRITFDPVEWITFEDTDRIEELDIEELDMPNGYYIHNPEIEQIPYEVDDKTEYRFIDWRNDFSSNEDGSLLYSTTDKDEFNAYLSTYLEIAANVPFWVTTKDGVVQIIEEQYIP